jgi:hypothetical protein
MVACLENVSGKRRRSCTGPRTRGASGAWYRSAGTAGTFTLTGRVLRLPAARGCPPLVVHLDRDVPYPAGQVRLVTLGFDAGCLYLDVTAEVPVTAYPEGTGPTRPGSRGWTSALSTPTR